MKDKPAQPLRGEAAWRAQKQEISKRNEAARAAGMRQRAAKDAIAMQEAARRGQNEMHGLRDD